MPENQDAVFPLLLLNPELDWKGTEKIKVQIRIASLYCTLYVITVCSLHSLSAFRCVFIDMIKFLYCSMYCLFFVVLCIVVCKCILYYCHWLAT